MANPSIVVEFIAKVDKLVSGVQQVAGETDKLGRSTKKVDWKNMAQLAAGATALAAGVVYIKRSADATSDLAKETAALQRITGLDTQTASAWISVLKLRGIETAAFSTGLVRLARLMERSRLANEAAKRAAAEYAQVEKELYPVIMAGGDAGKEATKTLNSFGNAANKAATAADKANAPFERLGVSQQAIKRGDVGAVLLQAADGFQQLRNPATKAAAAAELFGRQGLKLLPILNAGSEGIEKQLDLAKEYGAVVGDKQVEDVKKISAAQRELKLAQQGVAISLGSALLPAQVALWGVLLDITRALAPLTDNMYIMIPAIVLMTAAWVAYKVAAIVATVASIGLNASLLITVGIVAAVVVGLIVIAAALVYAYKRFDTFREIVDKTWSWIKRNWPLILAILLGPVALAVVLIIRHWGQIRDLFTDFITWLRGLDDRFTNAAKGIGRAIIDGVVGGLVGIGAAAWDVINNIGSWIADKATTIYGWGKSIAAQIWNGLVGGLQGIGGKIGDIFRAAFNAVIRMWNDLKIPSFKVNLPRPIPDVKVPAINFPNIPLLARGGVVSSPTLAMIGEGAGREIVAPEALLRSIVSSARPEIRVFIGDTELKGVVRAVVKSEDNRTAQVLLSGAH